MLSSHGRCLTFDSSAAGYLRGVGCGAVAIRRSETDHAALVKFAGSAVNHNGRSATLSAPNGTAQQAVIRDACRYAGVSATAIDSIECHGTGTSLGDPIELGALSAVFGTRQRTHPFTVGAAKTNIGHLELTAGVLGFIKCLLLLKKGC
jgi:acyl transferase domain-containing protein